MFGIGLGELAVLVLIGIIVLGPRRCVNVAKTLGKAWGKLQREWHGLKNDLSVDEDLRELKKDIEEKLGDSRKQKTP